MMGSRCGDLDPAIVPDIAPRKAMSLEQVEHLLNHDSGLLGLSGISSDTRILTKQLGEDQGRLALDVFAYRVRKYVGAYLAVLDGAAAVIFSGGIGENTPHVRSAVCEGLQWAGLSLDTRLNENTTAGDVRISHTDSRLHAWVIHADEALMLAHEIANSSER
jgi:acetate kinase